MKQFILGMIFIFSVFLFLQRDEVCVVLDDNVEALSDSEEATPLPCCYHPESTCRVIFEGTDGSLILRILPNLSEPWTPKR